MLLTVDTLKKQDGDNLTMHSKVRSEQIGKMAELDEAVYVALPWTQVWLLWQQSVDG